VGIKFPLHSLIIYSQNIHAVAPPKIDLTWKDVFAELGLVDYKLTWEVDKNLTPIYKALPYITCVEFANRGDAMRFILEISR
jgi:hypothetical protein